MPFVSPKDCSVAAWVIWKDACLLANEIREESRESERLRSLKLFRLAASEFVMGGSERYLAPRLLMYGDVSLRSLS